MMNKQLQRWIDRPGWQLCLWQWGILGLFGATVYGVLLRPAWQQQRLTAHKIIQQQQQVENQQSALAQLPSLSLIRQQMTALRVKEGSWWQPESDSSQHDGLQNKWLQNNSSIAHLVGEFITPFGGQVLHWQRQSEPMVDSVRHQRWHVTLRVNFHGLLHLLRHLAAIPSPVQVQLIEINSDNRVLIVKLNLKEYLAGGTNE
jgi:pilus assembly protein HofO